MPTNPYTYRNNPKLYKQWNYEHGICYDFCQPRRYNRCERRYNRCGYDYGCYKPVQRCRTRRVRRCGYYS